MYDYIIIGSGPAGLTLAWYLATYNKKILLLEREFEIGGCHRVRRVNGLFSEHGPRIVISNYFSLMDILSEMNIKFDDIFTGYKYPSYSVGKNLLSLMNFKELMAFSYEFIKFIFNENPSRNVTMREFTKKYNFKPQVIKYIDIICRISDGGTIDNYTLFEFLEILNQNIFYNLYQPKLPNDLALFKYWQNALLQTGNVDIILGIEVSFIHNNKDKIDYIIAKNKKNNKNIKLKSLNYIFAIPPTSMLKIIKNSSDVNMFGNINNYEKWVNLSKYLVYIPINFHWNTKVKTRNLQGITDSDYGISYIVMSDYTNFKDPRSQTVITCAVKIKDRKSSFNNKTADECNKEELISEVFRQLKIYQPYLPNPTYSILSPEMYKDKEGKWDSIDSAYFYTKAGYKSSKSNYNNLFWVGTHNGNSKYSFTAMESAMTNSIAFLHEVVPESKNDVIIEEPFTIRKLIFIIFILLIFIVYLFSNF
jgi:hypothetical protein